MRIVRASVAALLVSACSSSGSEIRVPRVAAAGAAVSADAPLLDACAAFKRERGGADDREPGRRTALHTEEAREHLRRAEAFGFSGGLGIIQNGRTVAAEGYGSANRAHDIEITPHTIFDIGSVAKQFTAAAILKLEDMGRLRTSDPISRFFPGVPADKQAITIHHLLTSSAGLAHDVGNRLDKPPRDEAVRQILASELEYPVGERHSYSNAGFALAAAIVEIASGETYEGFLRQHLWDPAGLRHTGMVMGGLPDLPKAEGYTFEGAVAGVHRPERWTEDGVSWLARGSGFVWSTTDDLTRWAEALRAGGLLSNAARSRLFWPHVSEGEKEPSYYAYGWSLSSAPDSSCVIAHDGSGGYHFAVLGINPEKQAVFALFTTQMDGEWGEELLEQVPTILFGGGATTLPAVAADVRLALGELTGAYAFPSGEVLTVGVQGGRLIVPMQDVAAQRIFSLLPAATAAVPPAGAEQAIAAAMADIQRADFESLLSRLRLPARTSAQRERRFWEGARAEWDLTLGPFRDFSIVKTVASGDGPRTLVFVRFERGARLFSFTHHEDGKLYIDVTIPLLETFLAPVAAREFITYHLRTKHSVNVRFEDVGGARFMVVQNGPETFRGRRVQ